MHKILRMKLKIGKRISEANIQAEFYRKCLENKLNCYLEYKYDKCRFDAVLYHKYNKDIYAIVEIKSYIKKQSPNLNTKQLEKYSQYNIPIYVIGRIEDIDSTIEKILIENRCFRYE